jgi:uncharacterized protein (DUF1501 family)
MKSDMSRRHFLKVANCAAVGTASLFSTLFSLRLTAGAASGTPPTGYKALVCLFLNGGNDSYNMLVPVGDANGEAYGPYNQYAAVRTTLALDRDDLLPISSVGQQFPDFGIHPNLPYLQTLYNQGNAAFVTNVGTLVEPTTLSQFASKSVRVPTGLFSHSDESIHWQTLVPQVRGAGPKGWAGRVADCMSQANASGNISMNLSLSGNNVFQVGNVSVPYITSPNGVVLPDQYNISNAFDPSTMAVDSILGETYRNLYQKTLATGNRQSIDTSIAFQSAIGGLSTTEVFPNSEVGNRLRVISNVIKARGTLGMDRQIFFVERGGWDHHNEVLAPQQNLFAEVNEAIQSFWLEMGHLGLQNDVVLFTASDFGRTLTSNGTGSDHAWGGNHFVIGGDVNGGKIYGDFPELATGSNLDLGRGRLLPTTPVDKYCAELASWYGVPSSELETVFPNSTNFFDPLTTPHPLGLF